MESLRELDLSANAFIGEIPADKSLSGTLNLSYNQFSGEIPNTMGELPVTVPETGSLTNQGPTAFLNNPLLCGFPLQKSCKNTTEVSPVIINNSSDESTKSIISKNTALSASVIVLISYSDAEELPEKQRGKGELVAMDERFRFELDELLQASAYVLGKSGSGIVYKVVLGNGIPVAVRRLGEGGEERYKEFAAEAQAIGRVRHPNVVRLRAYYWARHEKLLISDFISHGNLATAIRGRNGQPISLPWTTRLKILKGTARGLAYLHECSPRKIVHGDIKPSNILLDNESRPYISDFGLIKLITITGNNSSSGGLMGNALPYMKAAQTEKANNCKAPEGRVPGTRPTQKWDVYSFGVVMLELLTRKSPDMSTSTEILDLVRWVRKGFEDEKPLSDMVEPMLLQEVHAKKEVLPVFHVALSCTHHDPDVRPKMKTISDTLERIGS